MYQQGLFGEVIEEFRPPAQPAPMTLDFESHAVRMITIKGEPWWVAADVCRTLGISNSSQTVRGQERKDDSGNPYWSGGLDADEWGLHNVDTSSSTQEMLIVNEFGVFQLILKSRKPEAKRFKRWLTHDVLPSIRKTGSYTLPKPSRVTKVQKRLKSDVKTAERRIEVIDWNKSSAGRLASAETPRRGFWTWFDGLNKAQFNGKTASDLRKLLGLKKGQTALDHMGEILLSQRSHAICLAERKIQEQEAIEGKAMSMEDQLEVVYETVRRVVDSSFQCLGPNHGFGVVDDRKRGPVLDVVRQLTAA